MPDPQVLRHRLLELLRLLASEEEQLQYEANVPQVDITGELICMWFDDMFIVDSEHLREGFSPAEWDELMRFHQFYSARTKKLPESRGTVRTWLSDRTWREVMSAADGALKAIAAQQRAPGDGPGTAGSGRA